MIIYCITNLINGKQYVGKTTTTLEQRFKEHCRGSKKKYKNRPLYDAMNKYGIENFKIEQLEEIDGNDQDLLSQREIFWIKELQTFGKNGYNATKGGDGSTIYDPNDFLYLYNLGYSQAKVAEKMNCDRETVSRVLKAHNVTIRSCDKRVKQYDLANNYIRSFDSQTEAAQWVLDFVDNTLSLAAVKGGISGCCLKKRKKSYGYRWSFENETLDDNIYDSYSKNGFTAKVLQYTKDQQFLGEYSSIVEAAKSNQSRIGKSIKNISTGIQACCSGRQKTAFGFVWKYKDTKNF